MKFGVVFPQTEFGDHPNAIRDYTQAAEELGFNHILAYEHVLGADPNSRGSVKGPYTYKHSFYEPFLLFSYMAAITERIGFITGILILPQRQTALAAKQAATLDVLSQGRFRLGIGVGWNPVEYDALNQNFHTRGARVEEQIKLLRALWKKPLTTFDGRWHRIPDAGINPLPMERDIPIWIGGHADAVLDRIARVGNGWLPNYQEPGDARVPLARLDKYLDKHGRSRRDIGLEPRLKYGEGSPDRWLRTIRGWEELGATHLSINTMGCGFQTPGEHIQAIRTFAEQVGF